jgi:hypothetical protein
LIVDKKTLIIKQSVWIAIHLRNSPVVVASNACVGCVLVVIRVL